MYDFIFLVRLMMVRSEVVPRHYQSPTASSQAKIRVGRPPLTVDSSNGSQAGETRSRKAASSRVAWGARGTRASR